MVTRTIFDGLLDFCQKRLVHFIEGGLEVIPHSSVDFRFEDFQFTESLERFDVGFGEQSNRLPTLTKTSDYLKSRGNGGRQKRALKTTGIS